MLEHEIEDKVCRYARAQGIIAYKFTSPNRASVPDRLFIGYTGLHFFIEFKATGKKPTQRQQREIARLRERGHRVYIIDDIEEGKRVIELEIAIHSASLPGEGDNFQPSTFPGGPMAGHGTR